MEELIECGCERILTSGQKSAAPDAAELLNKLVQQAGDRIIIMPGAGINSTNIEKLIKDTGAVEYHGSAKKVLINTMQFENKLVTDFGKVYETDEVELSKILSYMN